MKRRSYHDDNLNERTFVLIDIQIISYAVVLSIKTMNVRLISYERYHYGLNNLTQRKLKSRKMILAFPFRSMSL